MLDTMQYENTVNEIRIVAYGKALVIKTNSNLHLTKNHTPEMCACLSTKMRGHRHDKQTYLGLVQTL